MSPRLSTALVAGSVLLGAASARAGDPARQWHAIGVEGGLDSLAQAANIEPGLPAWRVLYESSRRRHGLWGEDSGGVKEASEASRRTGSVPLPLAPSFWRGGLRNGSRLQDDQLPAAIVADRRSALFYRGIAGFDEATLAALAAAPDVLRRIQRRAAEPLAAFGSRFAVRDGVVQVPGGPEAESAWQAVVGESPRKPSAFLSKLLERDHGRMAFLYDSVARLEPARQRLALGPTGAAKGREAAALRALWATFEAEVPWWRWGHGAYARPEADAARVLREVRLTPDGAIAPPTSRAFWAHVFEGTPATPEAIRGAPRVDVAWLASRIGTGSAARRRHRLEQLSFAQRVFGAAAEEAPAEAAEALSGLQDARTLVLALERMGSREPAFFAAAVASARRPPMAPEPEERGRAHAVFQGALAIVDRARWSGTLDTLGAERLVRSLLAVSLARDAPWESGIGGWVDRTLLPALAAAAGAESDRGDADRVVLRALAGVAASRPPASSFDWEGLWYKAQPERGELRRLEEVRRRQGGARLDEALRECRAGTGPGRRPCDRLVGEALTSLVYSAHLGPPDGPALRGEDPARRHDFGADPWALPSEVNGPGVAWHVQGSLVGLETALARLSLRRIDGDTLPLRAPVIDATQRRRLALTAGLANPQWVADPDQAALASAVAAGRRRALALRADSPDLVAVARDAALDPWRARALEWLLVHEDSELASFFSLGELAYLGQPSGGRWDGWGAPDPVVTGFGLRLSAPRPLDESAGRRPEPALAEGFVDLGVRAALHLQERGLPASLAPALVCALLPDLFFEARPVAPDDRLALDAWTRGQSSERLDDAVASLIGRGPLQPASAPGGAP